MKNMVYGWMNYARYVTGNLDPKIEQMADDRLKKCDKCPVRKLDFCSVLEKTNHQVTGKLVRGCGCPIVPKALAPKSECPAGKWNKSECWI